MDRQIIRDTASKVLRSEDLATNERESAAEFLRANPTLGNPHVVRCDWCHETSMLFRDEDQNGFTRTARGWFCTACNSNAASQEVKF